MTLQESLSQHIKQAFLTLYNTPLPSVEFQATRKDFETRIVRQRGTTFQMTDDGRVSNIFEINLINKTQMNYSVKLKIGSGEGEIETVVKKMILKKEGALKERFIVKLPLNEIDNGKKILHIQIIGNGKEIDVVKTKFLGPSL